MFNKNLVLYYYNHNTKDISIIDFFTQFIKFSTLINYSYWKINDSGQIHSINSWNDYENKNSNFYQLKLLKNIHNDLSIYIVIKIDKLIPNNKEFIITLISSILEFFRTFSFFDGILFEINSNIYNFDFILFKEKLINVLFNNGFNIDIHNYIIN